MQKMRQGDQVQTSFTFIKKSFVWDKSKWSATYSQYVSIVLKLAYNKNKLYKTLCYWLKDMLNVVFLEKGLGTVSPPRFLHDFSRKYFSCYIPLTDQISLPDCLHFLRYRAICVLQLFFFSSSHFSTWPKSQNKNLNIWRRKRAFGEIKSNFHHF